MQRMRLSAIEELVAVQTQSSRVICPECGPSRKHHDPTLSITVNADETLYMCHHCGLSGAIKVEAPWERHKVRPKAKPAPQAAAKVSAIPTKLNTDSDAIQGFFQRRGIALSGLDNLPPMTIGVKFFPQLNEKTEAIGFVYGPPDNPHAIKWRPLDGRKAFTQDGAAQEFYGLRQLPAEADSLLVVEGECDAIALASIGVPCVSVPNGAPMKVSKSMRIDPEEDVKFSYIWEARELLGRVKNIILAVDQDEAGNALAEEIARRVGRAKCSRTSFPESYKDVSDVLVKLGKDSVLAALDKSEPMPLQGVYTAKGYAAQLLEFYDAGFGGGESTGFAVVDELFTIKEGMMYVVTGYPGSGKSEFIDAITVNLALKRQWKFAMASFENPPAIHIAKLAEKIVGKPFHEGTLPRMRKDELEDVLGYINNHYVFLENRDGSMATIASIIDRTKQAIMRLGVRGLVIDPYNYIRMENSDNENLSISEMLSEISMFAKSSGIAVFFIAHPVKIYPRDDGTQPVPKGNHISGSSAWWAKADVGLTVHRAAIGTDIHCWKSRFKWLGKQGQTTLGYDVPTGRYFESAELLTRPDPEGKCNKRNWNDVKGWDD
jgi:twinkle protein